MLPKTVCLAALGLAWIVELVLLALLVAQPIWMPSAVVWLLLHAGFSCIAAVCSYQLLSTIGKHRMRSSGFFSLLLVVGLCLPFIGAVGFFLALQRGFMQARLRHRKPDYWQSTSSVELPFTAPSQREATKVDSRGFEEHLMYSADTDDLYTKVLAAANMQTSLSVSALKQAMRHSDERIRLTAYKTLDRKVTELNRQIQKLESEVNQRDKTESSNSWLQIASNYWELLTLEQSEPVARQQLLEKAANAALQSIVILPVNRNAHFVLGRVSLLQGNTRRAEVAFTRARELGMPSDKVYPYLAEAAFFKRDFPRVRELLQHLDPAVRAYPPLSHVAEFWQ